VRNKKRVEDSKDKEAKTPTNTTPTLRHTYFSVSPENHDGEERAQDRQKKYRSFYEDALVISEIRMVDLIVGT
jgi:hypothetical protein